MPRKREVSPLRLATPNRMLNKQSETTHTRSSSRATSSRDFLAPVFEGVTKNKSALRGTPKPPGARKLIVGGRDERFLTPELIPDHIIKVEQWLRAAAEAGYTTAQHIGELLYELALENEEYKHYRQKQLTSQKDIWSEEIDRVLMEGFFAYRPMGRKTNRYNGVGRKRGRNELLQVYIRERSGHDRDRKQISSHIQVLKVKLAAHDIIMEFMCWGYHHQRERRNDAVLSSAVARLGKLPKELQMKPRNERPPPPSISGLGIDLPAMRLRGKLFQLSSLELASFGAQHNHTYTGSPEPTCVQHDFRYQDWLSFAADHPILGRLSLSDPIDCEILVAHASLSLPDAKLDAHQTRGAGAEVTLQTTLRYESVLPANLHRLKFSNSTFKNGILEAGTTTCDDVFLRPARGENIGSSFGPPLQDWGLRVKLHGYTEKMAKATGAQKAAVLDAANQDLQQYTILQQVSESGGHQQRLLVTCWTFSLTSEAEAKTTFHKLSPPPIDHATLKQLPTIFPIMAPTPPASCDTNSARNQYDQPAMHLTPEWYNTPESAMNYPDDHQAMPAMPGWYNNPGPAMGFHNIHQSMITSAPAPVTASSTSHDATWIDPQLFDLDDTAASHDFDSLLADLDLTFLEDPSFAPPPPSPPPATAPSFAGPSNAPSFAGPSTAPSFAGPSNAPARARQAFAMQQQQQQQQPFCLDPRLRGGGPNSTVWAGPSDNVFMGYPTVVADHGVYPTWS